MEGSRKGIMAVLRSVPADYRMLPAAAEAETEVVFPLYYFPLTV